MRRIGLLLVASGCLGVRSEVPATIDVTLAVITELHIDTSEHSFRVRIGKPMHGAQIAPCPLLGPELTAHLEGVEVPVISRGGKIGDAAGDDVSDNVCGTPSVGFDMPPSEGGATLVIADRAATLTCKLPDLRAMRQIMLEPPVSGTWQLRSGAAVTVRWSPASDLGAWSSFSIGLVHVNDAGAIDDDFGVSDVRSSGDLVQFTLPSLAPGSYQLHMGPRPSVTCGVSLVASVTSTPSFTVSQPVTIVP